MPLTRHYRSDASRLRLRSGFFRHGPFFVLVLCVFGVVCFVQPLFGLRLSKADSCVTTSYSTTETFLTATNRDPSTVGTGWPGTTGFTALPAGSNWPSNPSTAFFGESVLSIAAGDFNTDQIDDLAAVSPASSSGCS